MNDPSATVRISMRIPGPWTQPKDLIDRLPDGCSLTPETLTLPDGTEIDFGAAAADEQVRRDLPVLVPQRADGRGTGDGR